MSYNSIFSIAHIQKGQYIHYRDQNNLQKFPCEKYDPGKKGNTMKKPKIRGGVAA